MRKTKLFCIPYAGGSSSVYHQWKNFIKDEIEICPLELAGRGKRTKEPYYNNLIEAAEDLFKIINNDINNTEYAIWGHSMGALIGYELVRIIQKKSYKLPKVLFLSGRMPPHIKSDDSYYDLPDEEFIEKVRKMQGTPELIFTCKELFDVFYPILKADFKIVEDYVFDNRHIEVNCDLVILWGERDEMDEGQVSQWKTYANKEYSIYMFSGGHFFINDYTKEVIKLINNKI